MSGMASSMIKLGDAIQESFPEASEAVGRAAIKHGVTVATGGSPLGQLAGEAAGRGVGGEFVGAVGAGLIGGAVTGVAGMALTAALPFIGVYFGAKWIFEKLDA